jgi:Holliday junction resolvasome RuvABC DNA-binding subunit
MDFDDKVLKKIQENWNQMGEAPEETIEVENELLSKLKTLGFKKEKLNWMLNKVQDELNKEKEKTMNARTNSSLEVILTDVQQLIVEILNS